MQLPPFPRRLTDNTYLLCAVSTVDDNTAESDKLDASEASHVTTPRISSALPTRPSGLQRNHVSSIGDTVSTNFLVILYMHPDSVAKIPIRKFIYARSTNHTRRQRIHANVPASELTRHTASHLQNSRLGRAVCHQSAVLEVRSEKR